MESIENPSAAAGSDIEAASAPEAESRDAEARAQTAAAAAVIVGESNVLSVDAAPGHHFSLRNPRSLAAAISRYKKHSATK